MPARFPILKSLKLALILAAIALPGCAVGLPPVPTSDPADPSAPTAATAPLRPTLLATSRNYLSSLSHDGQQKAKETDMSKMKGHDMSSMSPARDQKPAALASAAGAYYTCPMHPEIHEAEAGQCPKCGMTLVERSGPSKGANP